MDDFVCKKLVEWDFSELIEKFKDEEIDKESLYCLDDKEIDSLIKKCGPRSKFKKQLKLLKQEQDTTNQETVYSSAQCEQEHEEAADSAQVRPSTSQENDKEKRKSDCAGESSKWESPSKKRRHDTIPEEIILSDVKNIMRCVNLRLLDQDKNKLNVFLKDKISSLETDKRELVGVFGKTGAGKSSLINAIIGEKNLLPSGCVNACTTVMIKVEANMLNSKYEADIEFISKEEWKDELWSLFNFLGENAEQEKGDDDDYQDTVEKLSVLYGEEWKNKSPENLMDGKYFKEIPEFLQSKRKILTGESAEELSAKFVKYTRSDSKEGEGVKRWYWPLVKCVTVRVPNNDLLQHITLVDLPGTGDRSKSRDTMWKGVIGSCSTVWIVTDINRAAAEKETWEILKSASSLMGNGGQCQRIHFICTKSDLIEDSDDPPAAGVRPLFKKNMQAKDEVMKQFNKLNKVKKHFSDDCFKVFTVSSKEFLKRKHLSPEETEIPKLQEILQSLNDSHSETLNYVSGAHGILSLIQGASYREVAGKTTDAVCQDLDENIRHELKTIRKSMEEAHEAFEKCLTEGVKKSESSCQSVLHSILFPKRSGRGFHRTLKCLVQNNGTYKPKKGKEIQLNVKLASGLTDSIDEEFKKTFPNEGKCGPFNGVINMFSLDTKRLIQEYKDVELQLIFLKTEEDKMKTRLIKIIRERKKTIYRSLTTTIEKSMQESYEKAAIFRGQNSMKNMRDTVVKHVYDSKNIMFERAKDEMLDQLRCLKEDILETLKKTMQKSIELSLKTDGVSIPDVTVELALVKKHHNKLIGSPDE